MSESFCIVKEHPSLIAFIDSLQKKNAESLSFYPRCVFEREAEAGRLFLGLLDGQPCGYIYVGAAGGDVKCHQVCIQYDVRRRLYGAALVVEMERYAEDCHSRSITLRCGFDLDANSFWKSLGYTCVRIVSGGIRRNRQINIWTKLLQPALFQLDAIEPSKGKTSAAIWSKHKQTGIVSGFCRGKKLRDYRTIVLTDAAASVESEPPR